MTITELSIKRPTLIIILFAALGVLGIFSFNELKYDLLPKISAPWVVVTTVYPGASPNEVETGVTKLIEDATSSIDKISSVYSTSQENISIVSMEFTLAADVNVALQDVQRKVNEIVSRMPAGSKQPTISRLALDEIPVLRMGVTSSLPSRDFYQFMNDQVVPRFSKLNGVGQVTLIGGDQREIKVNLDVQKLKSYGLSILQVTQGIKASNLDYPTGKIKEQETQYTVRLAGKFTTVEQLRNLVIAQSKQGGDIHLADVAEVQDGQKEMSTLNRINGVASIGILVQKQNDANSVEVSNIVRKEITKLEQEYESKKLKFDIAQDGSTFTMEAANAVKKDLAIAVLLVAMVMLLFLHSVRNSVIVMIAIPASLISTFIMMWIFGFSLNIMTLLGMSLVIGILVDDSIVVLENIHRFLERGVDQRQAALQGRNEIGFAALSITLVDVVVFVPLALVSGLVGNILREFALVVVTSTLLSLLVSFTITPMLASRFSKVQHLVATSFMGKIGVFIESIFDKSGAIYLQLLRWSLLNRKKVIVLTTALFFASLSLLGLGFIGAEFMTQVDRGEFAVILELPPGSTVENTNYVTQQVESIVYGLPEVQKAFVNVGASNEGLIGQSSNNTAELNVALVPKKDRTRSTDEVSNEIRRRVQEIPGVKVRANPIGLFGVANQTPIMIGVNSTDYEAARIGAARLADIVSKIPGTADVRLSSEEGKPETRVEIDREKMASFGISLAEVGATLRVALNGDDESKFREGSTEYDIRIVLDEFDRSNTLDVRRIPIMNRKGQQIDLGQFASIYQTTGPTKLQRQDRNYVVYVYSQAVGRASGTIVTDIQNALKKSNPIPSNATIAYLGDYKNQQEGFGSLGLAFLAAILFVYMIMVALYDSFIYPLVVLFSIPVAMIGALLALALMMKSMNIFTLLGIIMLVGLVGKNAILLVDRANQMRAEKGLGLFDALMEAGETRLRPILMTTTAMVFGMLPIALSTASGAEWKTGLAWALIGGLTSSMFLTLILVPVMYVIISNLRDSLATFFRKLTRRFRSQPDVEPVLVRTSVTAE